MTKYIIYIVFVLVGTNGFAQEDENIGTEVINVVKPYTPSVSDAFKVKEVPAVNDSTELTKKNVEYKIESVPVASTFTPAKGKAANVEKQAPKKLYNNYASLAVGNYLNVLGEFYATLPVNNTDNFTVGLNHHSTQGEIDGVQLDDKFYDTDLSLVYAKRDKGLSYQIEGGFKHQLYNWYGTSYELTDAQRADIDASHTYMTGLLGGHVEVDDSFFKGGDISYRRFWDDYNAAENNIVLMPEFEINVADKLVNIKGVLDYVGGEFDQSSAVLKYSYLKTGVQPSLELLRDDLTLNLGAQFVFGLDAENSESDFFIYPKVAASYRLLGDRVIAIGGLNGDLQQNSYYSFAQENKYIAPLIGVAPTDRQYEAYLGVKGKLSGKVNYTLKGAYGAEKNKYMFVMNAVNDVNVATENYQKANSFGVVYDDVSTFRTEFQLKAQVNKNYSIGLDVAYSSFNTDELDKVYNIPQLEASLFGDFKFNDKWFAGLNFFYIGERNARLQSNVVGLASKEITLKGFFDANVNVGYHVSNRFTAFIKANNVASQEYQRWLSYPTQQIQVLGGLQYKFDF
ncbi:TonB-dependent receptor [Pseudofulvibacter geojedonensis]|uniref:TonB-dependent receptor n=1 Tax=Pseudofulvibacter geojedonensis TaxID=1123758 RepID=A0ABW3I5A6_9FLAO